MDRPNRLAERSTTDDSARVYLRCFLREGPLPNATAQAELTPAVSIPVTKVLTASSLRSFQSCERERVVHNCQEICDRDSARERSSSSEWQLLEDPAMLLEQSTLCERGRVQSRTNRCWQKIGSTANRYLRSTTARSVFRTARSGEDIIRATVLQAGLPTESAEDNRGDGQESSPPGPREQLLE